MPVHIPSYKEKLKELSDLDTEETRALLLKVRAAIVKAKSTNISIATSASSPSVDVVLGELRRRGWNAHLVDDFREGRYIFIKGGE